MNPERAVVNCLLRRDHVTVLGRLEVAVRAVADQPVDALDP
jgi:hypothetical protein